MASDGTRGPVPVLGLSADNPKQPPVRLELRQMSTSRDTIVRDQWNLYLLGIEAFMKKDENSPLSYFQIAGIHGQPYQPWPNQPWNSGTPHVSIDPNSGEATEQQQWGGYCTHSSILFLTWHRPFLSLFETALYNIVNQIALGYTDSNTKARYVKAAKTFRMPYWDWALETDNGIGLFPREALASTIHSVVRPGGGRDKDFNDTLKSNPLASYKFGSVSQGDDRIDQVGNRDTTHPKATILTANSSATGAQFDTRLGHEIGLSSQMSKACRILSPNCLKMRILFPEAIFNSPRVRT